MQNNESKSSTITTVAIETTNNLVAEASTTMAAATTIISKSTTSSTPKKSITRCAQISCNDRAVKIIGDCRYCSKKFCGKHRLPEVHICEGLIKCKQESISKLSDKLQSERIQSSKIIKV
ncbi:hypothetical protein HDU92_002853 [Lobulomyces angularis]|nr:hypothetical protein HDU92_002853 [Lobulomyces angularis]